ncbi:TPA: IS3 family transposase [Streptococcus pyogenes]
MGCFSSLETLETAILNCIAFTNKQMNQNKMKRTSPVQYKTRSLE